MAITEPYIPVFNVSYWMISESLHETHDEEKKLLRFLYLQRGVLFPFPEMGKTEEEQVEGWQYPGTFMHLKASINYSLGTYVLSSDKKVAQTRA